MRRTPLERCRGARRASLCACVALAIPASAGAGHVAVPRHLVDGSVPPVVPKALRSQGGNFVMTKFRVQSKRQMRGLLGTCPSGPVLAARPIVERIGVNGRDITFLTAGSEIDGCDRNPQARAIHGPWCGSSGWIFRHGRVSDPRLDICSDRRGRPVVAFGWINPLAHAKWIVLDQPGFREVYPIAGSTPVRVSTASGIDAGSGTFHTAQYDAQGVLLARQIVKAAIAS